MAKEITLVKLSNNLCSAAEDETALALLKRVPLGGIIKGSFVAPRNPLFHRKFFAMLKVGFDAFEPEPIIHGAGFTMAPIKSREQFREDVTILAGHYELHVRLDGSSRTRAKSISFASMNEIEFEAFYSSVANVLLQKVLHNYTREDLDTVVDQILRFADG